MTDPSGGVLPGATVTLTNAGTNARHTAVTDAEGNYRFVVSFVLDLPFGRGKRFGSDASGFVNQLISGWTVNGIYTYRTGYPINLYTLNTKLYSASPGQGLGLGRPRPNVVAGCDADLGSGQSYEKWFNTDCFTYPGDFAVGNAPRNDDVVRMDGVNDFDLSVGKAFNLGGDTKLDFRVEAFNLFNRTQFGPPNMQVGARGYGSVVAAAAAG